MVTFNDKIIYFFIIIRNIRAILYDLLLIYKQYKYDIKLKSLII